MKRLTVVLILLIGIVLISGSVFARDIEEVGETIFDTLTGDNGSTPMLTSFYVAKTIKDKINLPLLGKCDWRTKLSYTSSIKQLNTENYVQLETGLEF